MQSDIPKKQKGVQSHQEIPPNTSSPTQVIQSFKRRFEEVCFCGLHVCLLGGNYEGDSVGCVLVAAHYNTHLAMSVGFSHGLTLQPQQEHQLHKRADVSFS